MGTGGDGGGGDGGGCGGGEGGGGEGGGGEGGGEGGGVRAVERVVVAEVEMAAGGEGGEMVVVAMVVEMVGAKAVPEGVWVGVGMVAVAMGGRQWRRRRWRR